MSIPSEEQVAVWVQEARALIEEGRPAEAISQLCRPEVPDCGAVCAVLALAYHRRGDARGDCHAALFFARRAAAQGFREPCLEQILATPAPATAAAEIAVRPLQYRLGGWEEKRHEVDAPYRSCALSRCLGVASTPKDFDWAAWNVPCQAACPAGTDIPGYLTAIANGDYDGAYRINLRDNVFPGVLGRVCARPCEAACRHGWEGLGEPVAICFSKRAAADCRAGSPVKLEPCFAPSGRHVAIVGAGPAGLAAARDLALLGHRVSVFEKHVRPGGMMNQGIPVFRLPREVVDREIDQVRVLGVDIQCGVEVGRTLPLTHLLEAFDAVVLAAGTLRPNLLNMPGCELQGIRHGLDFLLEANETGKAEVGRRVAVIGGGFTAMDCARTALRLIGGDRQAADVRVWYRRSVQEMLVTPGEIEELAHEGIPIEYMVAPVAYLGNDGCVNRLRLVRTRLGAAGPDGRRRPETIPGSEFEVPVDTVLLATGQFPQTDWIDGALRPVLLGKDGWLSSGQSHRTTVPKLFAAGDFAGGASSLIQAIGHARQCSRAVDEYLMGQRRVRDVVSISDAVTTGRIREMDFVPRQAMPMRPLAERDLTTEVERGYEEGPAIEEAFRCYRCHLKFEIDPDKCIYCDWCLKVKPRPQCILRVRELKFDGHGRITGWEEAQRTQETGLIWINQADCIRCGACVEACPVDAISIQRVDRSEEKSCEGFGAAEQRLG